MLTYGGPGVWRSECRHLVCDATSESANESSDLRAFCLGKGDNPLVARVKKTGETEVGRDEEMLTCGFRAPCGWSRQAASRASPHCLTQSTTWNSTSLRH